MAASYLAKSARPGDILIVIHDFDARSGDELTLRKSERVELIELDDGFSDGWYLGRHLTTGNTGLFPGVYTTKAPAPSLRSPGHSRASSSLHQVTTQPSPMTTMTMTNNNALASGQSTVQPQFSPPVPSLSSAHTRPEHILTEGDSQIPQSATLPAVQQNLYAPRSTNDSFDNAHNQDSHVMNETLNVIDEHITDLSTPRESLAASKALDHDSGSEYSGHMERQSFIAGPETDEEDNNINRNLSEAEVRIWSPEQTAMYLRSLGVDSKHCDIFREQEITGDVLLDMDQSFIYMKEYDFGTMGKRLKTWHKVRDLQKDVKAVGGSSLRTSERTQDSSLEDLSRTTSQTALTQTTLPRIPNLQDRSLSFRQTHHNPPILEEEGDRPYPLQPQSNNKRMSWAAQTPPSSYRATMDPENSGKLSSGGGMDRSKRHSSIDFGTQPDLELSSLSTPLSHNKQNSLDQTWSMAGSSTLATTPTSSLRPGFNDSGLDVPSPLPENSPIDVDRGYFSGTEVENQKTRNNRMSKAGARSAHARQTSMIEQSSKRASGIRTHSRLSSVEFSQDMPDQIMSPAAQAYHTKPLKGRFRSSSARLLTGRSPVTSAISPSVTNLESGSGATSPSLVQQEKLSMQDRARKIMGFRATSEAVTPEEKNNAIKIVPSNDTAKTDLASPGPTSTSTPSGTPSLDIDSADVSTKGADTPSLAKPVRPRPKTKQRTSAYTHGLMKIPPAEARENCDYSGWMKKKSSSIMTTWKPRLFILRGRRLSYYYSESDLEERGVIDISGHKVLVANSEALTTLHASMTGATSKTSPTSAALAPGDVQSKQGSSMFYFKLVPPKTGMSRAVQFTKPTVHYFQVDNIVEGRKWMGEIMKATIEHDLATFETTNKQKTISLAKARARRERPPALDDTKKVNEGVAEEADKPAEESAGLNIQGMTLQQAEVVNEKPLPSLVDRKPLPAQPPLDESNKENILGA